ncbi:MAG: type II secretion system F family protein [Planctomycetes bacterium]|nr:type II secretion system F family protein [Planctomycetota bacterium]
MISSVTENTEKVDVAMKSEESRPSDAVDSSMPEFSTDRQLLNAKVKSSDLIMFTTQLAVMLDSGVVLSDALDAIAGQSEQDKFKMILSNVALRVKNGENFSGALSTYPRVFSSMFVSMVKVSEASGRMTEMLRVLCGYLNFEHETRRRVKGALVYPTIMALMAVMATGTLMFFVLPKFTAIYEAKGAALPKITQMLIILSTAMTNLRVMTVAVTMMLLVVGVLYYWLNTLTGRRVVDLIRIRMPILSTMFVDLLITRSMRIMSTMLGTGVSLLDTIGVIRGSCDNHYFQQLWAKTDEKIRNGYQLSESIQLSQEEELIAPSIIQMLRSGEKSGKLGEVSDKISVFYEKKLEASIKSVTALIEPLMIIMMGIVIGTIAIALLLPVFKISTIIAH